MEQPNTGWQIAEAVRGREVSAKEVAREALDRIATTNPALNAFTAIDEGLALAQAAAIDAAIAAGDDPGPLAGVPIGVKDLEPAAGLPWTSGSRAYAGRVATYDSVQVERLKAGGAVVVGKTNTPEFGYKGFTDNLLYGPSRNPWNPERTPGGSSGGSAAAVAAGMVPIATGSDGGGSIRIPSAFSGCFGIKPTQGRIPRAGENYPGWSSLSHVGPIACCVRDAARYLDVAAGPHPNDLESLDTWGGHFEAATLAPISLDRVGWSGTLGYAAVDPEVETIARAAAMALAEAVGAEFVEVEPLFEDPVGDWFTLAAPGDAVIIDRMTPEQRELLDPGFVAFTRSGDGISGADIARALEARHQLNRRMTAFFEEFDLLTTPSVAVTAFRAEGPPPAVINGVDVGPAGCIPFAYPFNVTTNPAASIPAGLASDGLPVGLQVVGPRFNDARVLAACAAFEAAHPWPSPGL